MKFDTPWLIVANMVPLIVASEYSGIESNMQSDTWLLPVYELNREEPCNNSYVHKEFCEHFLQEKILEVAQHNMVNALSKFTVALEATVERKRAGELIQDTTPLRYNPSAHDSIKSEVCANISKSDCDQAMKKIEQQHEKVVELVKQATIARISIMQELYFSIFPLQHNQPVGESTLKDLLMLESNIIGIMSKTRDFTLGHVYLEDIYFAASNNGILASYLGNRSSMELLQRARFHASHHLESKLNDLRALSENGANTCSDWDTFEETLRRTKRLAYMESVFAMSKPAIDLLQTEILIIKSCSQEPGNREKYSKLQRTNLLQEANSLLTDLYVGIGDYTNGFKQYTQLVGNSCFPVTLEDSIRQRYCDFLANILPKYWQSIAFPALLDSEDDLQHKYEQMIRAGIELEKKIPAIRYWINNAKNASWPNTHGTDLIDASQMALVSNYFSLYAGTPLGPLIEMQHRKRVASVTKEIFPSFSYTAKGLVPVTSVQHPCVSHRLHIGFLSSHLGTHSVGKLFCGVIHQLVHENVFDISVVLLGNTDTCDEIRNFSEYPQLQVYRVFQDTDDILLSPKLVESLRLDVIVFLEIGTKMNSVQLAYSRLAPVQISVWGHPVTTGIEETIDYALIPQAFASHDTMNAWTMSALDHPCLDNGTVLDDSEIVSQCLPICTFEDMPENQVPYTERTVCTRTILSFFKKVDHLVTPDSLQHASEIITDIKQHLAPNDYKLYLFPHAMSKFHPSWDRVLSRILLQDPQSVVVLPLGERIEGYSMYEHFNKVLKKRLHSHFLLVANSTIDADDMFRRVAWFPEVAKDVYVALSTLADAVVDIHPVSSGVSALELLSVGVPMVSVPSETTVGPKVCGMYAMMNLTRNTDYLCANNTTHLVDLAIDLAHNQTLYREISSQIKQLSGSGHLFESKKAIGEWINTLKALHLQASLTWGDLDHPDSTFHEKFKVPTETKTEIKWEEQKNDKEKPFQVFWERRPPSPKVWS